MPARANKPSRSIGEELADSPALWFALLLRARVTSDRALERRARQALARAGITVLHGGGDQSASPLRITQVDLERIAARVVDVLRATTS
jgi:hypothetical protein